MDLSYTNYVRVVFVIDSYTVIFYLFIFLITQTLHSWQSLKEELPVEQIYD